MTDRSNVSRGREDRIVIVFAVVGPLLGYAAVVVWDLLNGDPHSMFRNLARQPWMLVAASLYGYLFGGLPALLAGWIAAKPPKTLHPALFIMGCAFAGFSTTAIFYVVSVLAMGVDMLPLLAIGGLAGAVCGALALRVRG